MLTYYTYICKCHCESIFKSLVQHLQRTSIGAISEGFPNGGLPLGRDGFTMNQDFDIRNFANDLNAFGGINV